VTVILNYLVPKEVFTLGYEHNAHRNAVDLGIILVSHRNYWRAVQAGRVAAGSVSHARCAVRELAVLAFLVVAAACSLSIRTPGWRCTWLRCGSRSSDRLLRPAPGA